jgi:hypothetical protein
MGQDAASYWLPTMSEQHKNPSTFWPALSLASIPLLYVVLFGPACWLVDHDALPARKMATIYYPFVRGATSDFRPVSVPLRWYGELFAPNRRQWFSRNEESVIDLMSGLLTMYEDKAE